jgi:hypothetical protein
MSRDARATHHRAVPPHSWRGGYSAVDAHVRRSLYKRINVPSLQSHEHRGSFSAPHNSMNPTSESDKTIVQHHDPANPSRMLSLLAITMDSNDPLITMAPSSGARDTRLPRALALIYDAFF